jgi:hypothetical protein
MSAHGLDEPVPDHAVTDDDHALRIVHGATLGKRHCLDVASYEAPITVCSPVGSVVCERQTWPADPGVVGVAYGL